MTHDPQRALDDLIALARRAEPPALAPLDARRAVRLAVVASEQPARAARPRVVWWCAACFALGLAVVLGARLVERSTTIEVAAGGRSLRVALQTGDSVVAAAGTRIELVAQEPARRALRLQTGSALFDVRPLAPQEQFEVQTPDARVRVRGTVFSVEVVDGRTIVRVYEGRVLVAERSLGAGETWVSHGAPARLEDDQLVGDGRAAAALRAEPPLIVSTLPVVTTSALQTDAGSVPVAARVVSVSAAVAPATLEQARDWLLAGESERALAAAQLELHAASSVWQLLEADALRALGRNAASIASYRAVAERDPTQRAAAGYVAALLTFHELHDAQAALELLDALALDAPTSPLRERASVLRVDLLLADGRADEARAVARQYLEREPDTQVSRRMRELVR